MAWWSIFLGSPAETIIFDPPSANGKGRFILLDSGRRMATELTTREVADFGQGLKQWAAQRRDPLTTFLVEPQFQEKFDAQTAQLTLSSEWMTYTVQLTTPVQKGIVDQYRVFSDWYARLNTVLNRGPGLATAVRPAVLGRGHRPAPGHPARGAADVPYQERGHS